MITKKMKQKLTNKMQTGSLRDCKKPMINSYAKPFTFCRVVYYWDQHFLEKYLHPSTNGFSLPMVWWC